MCECILTLETLGVNMPVTPLQGAKKHSHIND